MTMHLPEEFTAYTRSLMGSERYLQLIEGLAAEPSASIRLNPFKASLDKVEVPLADTPVPWCKDGFYLKQRPDFTFDPFFHAGLYYVQEASSMFLHHVLSQTVDRPVAMLDLCAAPGGKSTVARAALPEGSSLFSNEPIRQRARILNENILKFGHPDVIVTNNYARDYRQTGLLFDVILADVPCSGEGMFRKDEGAIAAWSPQNVDKCCRLQREIVADIWPLLKPGGIFIYSTCTFNAHENEENATWIATELGAEFIEIDTQPEWNLTGSLIDHHPVYRFLPGFSRGEGLFVAVLRKAGDNSRESGYDQRALKGLNILSHGIMPDEVKGKDLIPDTSKALSIQADKDAYPRVEVSWKEAIAYLRHEAVALPDSTPRGVVLLTYQGQPIGFEKNIGNRANNLYPQEWRIKSTHVPEKPDILIMKENTYRQ